jgi:2-C-methyl-D-erythritol 4-phosphate cytidylyltransferase
MNHTVWGLIVASGKEEQLGSEVDTAFLNLGGKPVISYSLKAFEECPDVDGIAVVCRKERMAEVHQISQLFGFTKLRKITAGSATRWGSIVNGAGVVADNVSILLIHDVCRPHVTPALLSEAVKTAKRYGCGVIARKIIDPVRMVPKGHMITETLDLTGPWISQSPFACKMDLFKKALENVAKKKKKVTDELLAVQEVTKDVRIIPSTYHNLKIASPDDLALSEMILRI